MQSSDDPPQQFSRMAYKRNASPQSQHQQFIPSQLQIPAHLEQALKRNVMAQTCQHTGNPGDIQQTTALMLPNGNNIVNGENVRAGLAYGQTLQYSHLSNATFNGYSTSPQNVGIYHPGVYDASMGNPHATGDAQHNERGNDVHLHPGLPGTQQHHMSLQVQNNVPTQYTLISGSYGDGSFRQDARGYSGPQQQNLHNPSQQVHCPPSRAPPTHHPLRSAGHSSSGLNEFDRTPLWLQDNNANQAHPAMSPQFSNGGAVALDTPPKDTSHQGCELDSPLATYPEASKGSQPTQVDQSNIPASDLSPKRSACMQWQRGGFDSISPVKRESTGVPSPSIDVDNEDNNLCGGVNRRLPQVTIDLSEETNEAISKLKKPGGQKNVEHTEGTTPCKVPRKRDTCNEGIGHDGNTSCQVRSSNGTNPTGFVDPLHEMRRRPTGPPPPPFPKESSMSLSPRRSTRLLQRQRANTNTSPDDTAVRAQPSDSPVDHRYPLGGVPKENREKTTNGNSFMNSNRSTAKRRRPSRARKVDPKVGESFRLPKVEERSCPGARGPKRRRKQDERRKFRKEHSSTGEAIMAPTPKENIDENSDQEISLAIQRKKIVLSSQDISKEHPGDSPLSNTVGDDSHSDDDDIGGGGNELSSDDDATPPPKRTSPASRTQRSKTSKVTRAHKSPRESVPGSATSKMICVGSLNDSDDENFMESRKNSVKRNSKEGERRMTDHKRSKEPLMAPSSPVDLVTPPSSCTKGKPTRRSPRNAKKSSYDIKKPEEFSPESSDEDFDDSGVNDRGRSKTDRGTTTAGTVSRTTRRRPNLLRKQRTAEGKTKQKQIEHANVERLPSDEDADSPVNSSGEEESGAGAGFPSQEQGSQPIDLTIAVVKKRKKPNPKVFPEREFKKMSPEELSIIRVAFIKRYPAPPSNMQAQGRYEAAYGTEMTAGMVQQTWETQLKPWSERWWKLYLDFNEVVREKKLGKPRNKDPRIKEKEVKAWVEAYYEEHGDAKPPPQATGASDKAQ